MAKWQCYGGIIHKFWDILIGREADNQFVSRSAGKRKDHFVSSTDHISERRHFLTFIKCLNLDQANSGGAVVEAKVPLAFLYVVQSNSLLQCLKLVWQCQLAHLVNLCGNNIFKKAAVALRKHTKKKSVCCEKTLFTRYLQCGGAQSWNDRRRGTKRCKVDPTRKQRGPLRQILLPAQHMRPMWPDHDGAMAMDNSIKMHYSISPLQKNYPALPSASANGRYITLVLPIKRIVAVVRYGGFWLHGKKQSMIAPASACKVLLTKGRPGIIHHKAEHGIYA